MSLPGTRSMSPNEQKIVSGLTAVSVTAAG